MKSSEEQRTPEAFIGEEKVGNKARRGKNPVQQSGKDRRPRSHCSSPAGCRGCEAAVQGVGHISQGRLAPPGSAPHGWGAAPHRPAQRVQLGRQRGCPGAVRASPAERSRHKTSSSRQGRAQPPLRCGPGGPHLSPALLPIGAPIQEPRSRRSVRSPAETEGRRRAGRARRSTGGSRPQALCARAAHRRAAAAEQAGKRSLLGDALPGKSPAAQTRRPPARPPRPGSGILLSSAHMRMFSPAVCVGTHNRCAAEEGEPRLLKKPAPALLRSWRLRKGWVVKAFQAGEEHLL
ncbi:uncharacterized protein LOC143655461 [Tamandua tetradactyla]|uniref:uncharacterized protein LOC143655461 n=1 Tax=Tamandua tetradactyla TaxID=48850 RepID=UPI00405427CC